MNAPMQTLEGMATKLSPDVVALDKDAFGVESYASPIPGLDANAVIDYRDLIDHVKYIHFADATKNGNGGTTIYKNLYKGAGAALKIQLLGFDQVREDNTGGMRAPFGMQLPQTQPGESTNPDRQNFDLSIDNPDLLDFLNQMDARTLEVAKKRWLQWGQKPKSEATIEGLYKPLVTLPSPPKPGMPDRKFSPTVRTKIALAGRNPTIAYEKVGVDPDGTWQLVKIDPREKLVIKKEEKKQIYVLPVVTDIGIWFMGTQFGNSLQLSQVILLPSSGRQVVPFCGGNFRELVPQPQYGLPTGATAPGVVFPPAPSASASDACESMDHSMDGVEANASEDAMRE